MWTNLRNWLRNPPAEEPVQAHVERLIRDLCSPEPAIRRRTDLVVARILGDDAGCGADFRLELLRALAEYASPEQLDFIPRYVHLLADTGFPFGRPSPLQLAARACLNRWQSGEDERAQSDLLLRAAERPANRETLLRPASGTLSTAPEELLRASAPENDV